MSHTGMVRWIPTLALAVALSAPLSGPAWADEDIPVGAPVLGVSSADIPSRGMETAIEQLDPGGGVRVGTLGWELDTGGPGTRIDRDRDNPR